MLCKQLDSLYRRLVKVDFNYNLQVALGNVESAQHMLIQLDTIQLHIEEVQKELREAFEEVEK